MVIHIHVLVSLYHTTWMSHNFTKASLGSLTAKLLLFLDEWRLKGYCQKSNFSRPIKYSLILFILLSLRKASFLLLLFPMVRAYVTSAIWYGSLRSWTNCSRYTTAASFAVSTLDLARPPRCWSLHKATRTWAVREMFWFRWLGPVELSWDEKRQKMPIFVVNYRTNMYKIHVFMVYFLGTKDKNTNWFGVKVFRVRYM